MKIEEILSTSTFAWSHDCLPILATGTVAGAVDIDFNSSSTLELYDIFSPTNPSAPVFSAVVDHRFHALAWSQPFDSYNRGILAGAFENGTIEIWNVETLISTKDLAKASIFTSTKHSAAVKSLAFNPKQPHILVSGGSKGEIFIWDTKTFDCSVPGQAMTPMDEITSVAWNNAVGHIMASTSGGYTSIWDLKSKREVLHLSYNGDLGRANFSFVAWHPTQSTKLITASDNDGCPLILTWDLRNANAPEKIMKGHKKGVLSLDWCKQDPELLISSGKDNSTLLWNPIEGVKLGEYPTTANWAFLTKFAPSAPDIFATASFDGKIIVQSLQDTSPPVTTKVTTNDDDFWNEISTTDTQQPIFDVKQPPLWLKRPSNVSFGFGKLVTVVTKDGKSSVEVKKIVGGAEGTEKIAEALKKGQFNQIIDDNLNHSINDTDKADWEMLKKLSDGGKKDIFKEVTEVKEPETVVEDVVKDDGDFFDNLTTPSAFVPSGDFELFPSSGDTKLTKLILTNKLEQAVNQCLATNNLTEALILALDASDDVKTKVKNAYFSKESSQLSRVLYSASIKDSTDILSHADVKDWKFIATAIESFAKDDTDFNDKVNELGDRVLKSGSRDDAIACYLAGGAMDKISSIWLKELPDLEAKLLQNPGTSVKSPSDARFEALNNFATKLVAYRTLTHSSGALSGPSVEPVCKVILEYVTLLSSFGQFELAEKFLGFLPSDYGSGGERERISKALAPVTPVTKSSNQVRPIPGANGSSRPTGTSFRPNVAVNRPTPGASFKSGPPSISGPSISGPSIPATSIPGPSIPGQGIQPPGISPVPTPSGNVASNPYMKPSTSNPYMKPSNPSNPYTPSNPYMKQTSAPVATPPPVSKPYKQETDGWNDLPDTFKPKAAPRRAAAASTVSPSHTPGPSRPSLVSPPSSVSIPSGPPKGPSRAPSSANLVSPRPPNAQVSNPYAPQTSGTPGTPGNPYAPKSSVVSPRPGQAFVAPPTNAFTPTSSFGAPTPPANPYAAPPANPYAAPTPPANPYAAPPAANPYAPSNGHTRVPSGGIVPPPKSVTGPPPRSTSVGSTVGPPPLGPSVGPPPMGPGKSGPPSNTVAPPTTTSSNGASQPQSYPSGDRSHISPEALPIYEIFNARVEFLKPRIPDDYKKHGDDMERRLNMLYDHLNNGDLLSSEAVAYLKEVAETLDRKDYESAKTSIIGFASTFPEEVGNWHTGVKRLVQMDEALSE
ncbi:protein transport protein Sec31p [[Candida] jaroonii]|uniref:Protein transport protein Sec31p n=1 Tax=[Candida] jaroonii TaxID=467808 RepID=A0ACA9YA28_9ASCO|nr:protein transport protein Sec31p [[Candida] jaroonii]